MFFKVTVVKKLEVEIPVEANDADHARKMVNDLLDKRDYDFMFGNTPSHEYEYGIDFICRVSQENFRRLSEECEAVLANGSHDWL